jgi:ABC-type lipoprotein export system ATPase subunit
VKEDVFSEEQLRDFFSYLGIDKQGTIISIDEYVRNVDAEVLEDLGIDKDNMHLLLQDFLKYKDTQKEIFTVESITVVGGYSKTGDKENVTIKLKPGEIISIVGPTGSGKSRLLEDIEWMAQEDTPTKRKILINGKIPDESLRFSVDTKLVAQLSQNMNFIMDTSVGEFIELHAESRNIKNIKTVAEKIIDMSNELAGEKFNKNTALTSLSGGQSRALMIADTAYLSNSPIVLIDEIENAGIDRRKAIELLVKNEKIIIMATHDPILALMAGRRVVIKNGGINKIIKTTVKEKSNLNQLEEMDKKLLNIRNKLRLGEIIDDV